MSRTTRTVAIVAGSVLASAAFISSPDLLPFLVESIGSPWLLPAADSSLMLVTVGLAAPGGLGFSLWQVLDYVAIREDLRVSREVQPEPELKAGLR
jgi:hypothetical protein